jgi:hypothetical protein
MGESKGSHAIHPHKSITVAVVCQKIQGLFMTNRKNQRKFTEFTRPLHN